MSGMISPRLDPALEGVLATALDAVVVMTADGRIAGWNGVAEDTFGWSSDEVRGFSLAELIVPPQHRAAHRRGMQRLAEGGEPRVLDRRIEITALHRDGHELPVELSITTAPGPDGEIFVGFIRDISDRHEAARSVEREAVRNRLMFEVASMAADSDSFEDALRRALGAICQITGWPVGHAFVVSHDNQQDIRSSDVWFETQPGIAAEIRRRTEELTFRPGFGLPGTVLQTRKAQWVSDTSADRNFFRKDAGFRGAFAFPLKGEGRIIAILEFFSQDPVPPDESILLTVQALGEQAGRVFERLRTRDHEKLLLHELNHRVKNILAVVHAVAQQTFRSAKSLEDARAVLAGRLVSISKAQDILFQQTTRGAVLGDIIEGALAGTGIDSEKTTLSGPAVTVSPRHAVTISLAIHELATNALKYGAFSTNEGRVSIEWGYDADRENFRFSWCESGGPAVATPTRKGFGTRMIERGLASDLGGEIVLDYRPEGLCCTFRGPIPRPDQAGE
ncbi:sensor histidine kinase [Tsuneonella sp. SYSU-LHT278]|uniref:sensor histidine kinase n=1 Tax=Tsuneonella sediminis TaxID=3416089 RepID=UPI003F7B0AA4